MGRHEERRDEILLRLRDAGLGEVAERAAPSVVPSLRLSTERADVSDVGASKLGGAPDLPIGVAWPEWQGLPLGFVGQIRLRDVADMETADPLPRSGLLSFFYDRGLSSWGFDPKDAGSAVVLYSTDADELERRAAPDVKGTEGMLYEEAAVTFADAPCFPIDSDDIEMDEDAFDRYFPIAYGDDDVPRHQLLGRPDCVQGNSMDLECQLVTNGLFCGDASGYEDTRAKTLEPGAKDWQLLLQLDTDPAPDFMWCDAGMVYFWIRKADLEARVFHRVWLILQTT